MTKLAKTVVNADVLASVARAFKSRPTPLAERRNRVKND